MSGQGLEKNMAKSLPGNKGALNGCRAKLVNNQKISLTRHDFVEFFCKNCTVFSSIRIVPVRIFFANVKHLDYYI